MTANPRQILVARRQHISEILVSAVQELERHDAYLLEADLKEEAVNHRLAVYLERAIGADPVFSQFGFCIDAEYNRFGLEDKSVPNTWDPADLPARKRDRRLRPDIIVHQRGSQIGRINLLTVEVKKSSTINSVARRFALWKSEAYRSSNLAYIFAAYICLNSADDWEPGKTIRELRLFAD